MINEDYIDFDYSELCNWCKNDIEHSLQQHEFSINEYFKEDVARIERLDKWARFNYDHDIE